MSSFHQITKREVDRYTTGKRTPSCQLLLAWTGEEHEKPSDLFHQICLIGAKGPQNFITIESNLQQHSKGTTLGSLLSVSRTWTNTSLYPQQLLQLLQSPIQVEKRHTLVRIILSLLYIMNMKNWGWVLAQRKCLSGWFNYPCACAILLLTSGSVPAINLHHHVANTLLTTLPGISPLLQDKTWAEIWEMKYCSDIYIPGKRVPPNIFS